MKKLMIATAAVALAAVAQAGIAVRTVNCNWNSSSNSCDQIIFKVTGSGKALDPVSKDYTTVSKLKVNGWLVMFPDDFDGDPLTVDCCYPTYSLYINAKIGKNSTDLIFAGAGAEAVDAWTLFGKKLADTETYTVSAANRDEKKSKKFKLESQLGISADALGNNSTYEGKSASSYSGTLVYADDVAGNNELPGVTFIATAFGKATWKTNVQKGCNKCDKPTYEGYDIDPGSYSGWFAGFYVGENFDEECMTCLCTDLAVFGGTWKAKYQTKVTTWEAAITNLFGSKTLADMRDEGIE